MRAILLMTLFGITLATPDSLPQITLDQNYDETYATVTPVQNYSETMSTLKLNMSTDENFTQNIIKFLFQDRAYLQEKVNELNKDNCDLRTQLSQFTENVIIQLETEAVSITDENNPIENSSNLVQLIKSLRSEIVLESQNHKRNMNILKLEHFRSLENIKMEYTQIINSLKLEINRIKSESLENIINLRKEKKELDEDISRLRKLRREDLIMESGKSKYEKNLISSNVECIKEVQELKIFSNSLNYSNALLVEFNSELKELNNNLTIFNKKLSKDIEILQEANEILGRNINNVTEQSKNALKDKEEELLKMKNEMQIAKNDASKKEANTISNNGVPYRIENNVKLTWSEAKNLCEFRNMTLAKIETAQEREFLTSHLNALYSGWNHFWIGSTDEQDEEVWKWYGTNISVDTSIICTDHVKSTNINCLTTCKHGTTMAWHSLDCNDKNPVICERKC